MLRAPLLLDALLEELKKRKLPFKLQDQVKELYEVCWREAFKEGAEDALEGETDEQL